MPKEFGGYNKTDLYDQNLVSKIVKNDIEEENVRLRTRVQMMQGQLKGKDKLIDDLYKDAYISSASGNPSN